MDEVCAGGRNVIGNLLKAMRDHPDGVSLVAKLGGLQGGIERGQSKSARTGTGAFAPSG